MKNENVFFLTDPAGIVPKGGDHGFGLYYHDCRYLCGYELKLAGAKPLCLVSTAAEGYLAAFQLTNPDIRMSGGALIRKEGIGIKWERMVDAGKPALDEVITLENFEAQSVAFSLTLTFESREYRDLRQEVNRELEDQRRQLLEGLDQRARKRGFAVSFTPVGTARVSLSDDRQMTPEEVARLPDEEKERLRERGEEFSPLVSETLDQIRRLERETHGRVSEADAQVARNAIAPLIRDYQNKYREQPRIVEYLNRVLEDLVKRTEVIRAEVGEEADEKQQQSEASLGTLLTGLEREIHLGPLFRERAGREPG